MTSPEPTTSSIEIFEIEKNVPAPLRPAKKAINLRKTLPPLPPPTPLTESSPDSSDSSEQNATIDSNRATTTTSDLESLLTALGGNEKGVELSLGTPEMEERPPRPVSKDPFRPATAATTVTVATTATAYSYSSQRTIKYGTGKHANIELSPQPSEDPDDPLNWPLWKKHLNLGALLSMVALVGVMKTAYISVNSAIAIEENDSYTSAVALTAVPLMLSAVTGLASLIIARLWGKRPVYLVSMVMIFIGVVWNTHVRGNMGENMAARVFQGLGWGAFDTLTLASIQDTYFEHERQLMIVIHYAVSIVTMIGSPLLGGVASDGPRGFELQFEIMSAFLTISILLLVFGAPETTYNRVVSETEPPTIERSQALFPTVTYTKEAALGYIAKMKPWSYQATKINIPLILQAPRAMFAPTTGLLFTLTLLPYAGLWGFASSLSLLFSPLPFMLTPGSLGALMTGPFLLATPVAIALALPLFHLRFAPIVHLATLAIATVIAAIGMLGFGLYLAGSMAMPSNGSAQLFSTTWELGLDRVSLPVVSFLLGLLAVGSLGLDATIRPVIQRSTAFTSANLAVGLRNTADMHGGLACLRNLAIGTFILGLPDAVFEWDGLEAAALGMGITQIAITAGACGVYWYWDENVRRLDGRVMGLIDLSMLKKNGSFFETD
ncbi:MFS general substrate transporter [Hypoxylon trugodes]|uniref:MFS general substrate transporter n=1 Tax=Hypoxylon trugodes TaxID=326681 RepID=UPI00219A79AB|nr:MFS general substrate transporter [Hypoxylon trugodes]KAI1386079.1 MFS general substrate transporter [Hypoxylon trugodes]